MSPALLAPLLLCLPAADPAASDTLEARLAPLIKAHKGKVAVAVKHLGNGESYTHNADEPMPTASLIKLPVMIEVYQQVEEGKIKLSTPIMLRDADKVPGSGILTDNFSEGATLPLRDLVRLMIVFSDNTATNMVLDQIGIDSTNKRMEAWGFENTRINAKVYRGSTTSINKQRTDKFGLGSTTANEMVAILEKLNDGKAGTAEATKAMLEHLKKCDDKEKMPRFLPAKVELAHKTGSVNDSRTDAGILFLPSGPVAVCVLTTDNEDKSWNADNAGNLLCARVAKEVFEHFSARPDKPAKP
jgi:beta-lactamase class A